MLYSKRGERVDAMLFLPTEAASVFPFFCTP
jgi:hypothetical protein